MTTLNDIFEKIDNLKAGRVLIDFTGSGKLYKETWNIGLSNEPTKTLKSLKSNIKASFQVDNFNHAKNLYKLISEHFKNMNEFPERLNFSEDNLHMVIEVIYN